MIIPPHRVTILSIQNLNSSGCSVFVATKFGTKQIDFWDEGEFYTWLNKVSDLDYLNDSYKC